MDGEGDSKQKSIGHDMSDDCDFSKPIGVRHIGLQVDAINQRLLEYNVRSLWISIPIIIIVAFIL